MTEYRRIGDYISLVDDRNTAVSITNLVGLTIAKKFIPSVANINGTDLSNYKIIRKGQFACSLMQVSRDGKFPVAMYAMDEPAIMSPAYPMFEVTKLSEILPEYMILWFSRSEFDREACFYAVGGVRGSLDWEDFCNMKIPVPDIATQRRIVAEYQAVEKRIATNERLIAILEETAQTIYKKMFIDDIDQAHLPDGWKQGTLSDLGVVVTGKTPSSEYPEDFGKDVPFLTPGDFHPGLKYIDYTERSLSIGGAQKLASKMLYKNDVAVTCIGYVGKVVVVPEKCITNQQINSIRVSDPNMSDFAYYYLCSITQELENAAVGSSTLPLLNKNAFELIHCLIPPQELLDVFYDKLKPINSLTLSLEQENVNNRTLLELLLSKMSK